MALRRTAFTLAAAVLVGSLAACGEEPQTAKAAKRRSDVPAYQGAADGFVAPGWKPGDKASWEQQMRTRAMAQNEYARTQH
jgi:hypothetical protein